MSETHRVVNIRELDDDAAKHGIGDQLEAHFARDALGCQGIGISLQRIKPGVRSPMGHRHATDEEIYLVVAGTGRAVVEGEVIELKAWDALRVPASSARSFEADEDGDGLEFVAFGTHTEGDRGEFVDAGWPG